MSLMKRHFLSNNDIVKKSKFIYLFVGICVILIINKIIDVYFLSSMNNKTFLMVSSIVFLLSILIAYLILKKIQQLMINLYKIHDNSLNKEKERLMPYEFALNNSVDAIYWFTLDAKFEYVNDAACKMLGYKKEELIGNYLEFMDTNFTRETAPLVMEEIKNTPNWRLESTQRKKTGEFIDIEVSGHGFYYNGQKLLYQ